MKPRVVVFITAPSTKEARTIAASLVRERLAACVGVLPGVRSIYRWKSKVESAREVLLLAKTTGPKLPSLIRRVKALHSYDVPEVIALPILAGNQEYLHWIDESV